MSKLWITVGCVCVLAGACGDDSDTAPSDAKDAGGKDSSVAMQDSGGADASTQSLCDKYGGKDAIAKVIAEKVVPEITGDCRVNGFFAILPPEHVVRLVDCLSTQAQELFGCEGVTYAGSKASNGLPCRSMKEAHSNMGVSKGDFDALIDDVVAGLTAAGVEEKDIMTAAPALLGLESSIVEKDDVTDPSKAMCMEDGGAADGG